MYVRSVKTRASAEKGRFAYQGIERVMHEKARLSVLVSLVTHDAGLRFGELKTFCALTDGNLSRHLDVLSDAGIVEISKGFEGRKPQTFCRISADGKRRFKAYLEALKQVVRDAGRARR
jgi:DNA-binding transcriptional ArsR family regulator